MKKRTPSPHRPRATTSPPAPSPPDAHAHPLRSAEQIAALIEKTVRNAIAGRCPPELARTLLYAAQCAVSAVRSLKLEQQLADIQDRLADLEAHAKNS